MKIQNMPFQGNLPGSPVPPRRSNGLPGRIPLGKVHGTPLEDALSKGLLRSGMNLWIGKPKNALGKG